MVFIAAVTLRSSSTQMKSQNNSNRIPSSSSVSSLPAANRTANNSTASAGSSNNYNTQSSSSSLSPETAAAAAAAVANSKPNELLIPRDLNLELQLIASTFRSVLRLFISSDALQLCSTASLASLSSVRRRLSSVTYVL